MEKEYAERLAKVEQRAASNTHRLDDLEEQTKLMYEMNKSIALIAKDTKDTREEVKGLKGDVEEIKSKPNKLLDSLLDKSLGYIVTAIIAAIIALALK